MSRARTILRNVASNWAGFAVNAAVTLVLTPLVLRHLGPAGYGIWVLSSSIIGYYGLLDLGFRAGVTQYLTRYLAAGDDKKASECISTAVVALGGLGFLLLVLSVGAAYVAPRIFQLPADLEREAFWTILIVGGSAAIQFSLQPFSAVFTATQRFDLANLIGVTTRLVTAGLVVVALWLGYGLIGISAATCIVSLLDYVLRWRVSKWLAPRLLVSLRSATVTRLREIAAFGAWNFLISINTYVYQYVPSLLIGTLMPIAAVGYFALAASLSRQVNSVLAPIGQVIYPAAVDLHVHGDRDRLERLYHDGSRLTMLAMIPVVLLGMFWAPDFYRLWVGPGYVENSPYGSVAVIFQILLLSTFTSFSNIAGQILMGAGQIRLVAIALVSGSVLALSLSLGLVEQHGLFGVALAFVIASVLVDLLALPLLLQRVLGLSVTGFLRRACLRPVTVAVAQVLLILGVKSIGEIKDWMDLILQGLLAGSSCMVVVLFIGITAEERQRLLLQPIRSLFRKMFSDLRVWRG